MQTHLKGYFHTVKLASKYKRNKYERNSILWKTLMTLLQLRALTLIQSSDRYCLVPKSCPALCKPMDCSPPGSCVHGISQARILEWVAISCFRGSSWPSDWIQVSYIAGRFFTTEPPGNTSFNHSTPVYFYWDIHFFFIWLWVTIWCLFISSCRTASGISCKAGLKVINTILYLKMTCLFFCLWKIVLLI